MERMADRLAAFMVSAGMIKEENRKYYRYGMELLLTNFFNFSVVLFFGLLTHKLFLFLCYMVVYGTLRKTSDGYHAKSHVGCISIYMAMLSATVFLLPELYCWEVIAVALGVSTVILFLFAPVETERSRVKTEMLRIKRLRTRGFILCMDASCGIVICLKIVPKELVCIIAGACLFQSMTVLVQTALNYKNNQKKERQYVEESV